MGNVFRRLHPRRAWLWAFRKDEIQTAAALLLPSPYRLDVLIREYRSDLDAIRAAGLIDFKFETKVVVSTVMQVMKDEGRRDAALGALEGAAIYGEGILEQLQKFDGELAHVLGRSIRETLLNTSNLGLALATVANLAEKNVSQAFLPFAQPVISSCLSHAESWCQEHVINTASQVSGLVGSMPAALHGNLDGLTSTVAGLHGGFAEHSWLDPSDGITSHPLEVISTHVDQADAVNHVGDTVAHGVADAGISHVGDHAASIANSGIHVPWFSLARSGHREYNLLKAGKTDLSTSAKNVALDAGPMAIGAKAGAIVGTAIFPGVGTAIGAAIGGISGKLVGTHVKQADLRAATAKYEQHLTLLSNTQESVNATLVREFEEQKEKEQKELNLCAEKLASHATELEKAHASWRNDRRGVAANDAEKILGGAVAEIDAILTSLLHGIQTMGFSRRWVWPDVEMEARRLAFDDLSSRKRVTQTMRVDASKRGEISVSILMEYLAQLGVSELTVRNYLQNDQHEAGQQRNQFETKLKQSQADILRLRYEAIAKLDQLLKNLADEAKEKLKPLAEQLQVTSVKLVREKEKLGMT